MKFIPTTHGKLRAIEPNGAYIGASTAGSIEEFKKYIRGKSEFGSADPDDMTCCYFVRATNVQNVENLFLQKGFEYNIDDVSRISPEAGFVYICTRRERIFVKRDLGST